MKVIQQIKELLAYIPQKDKELCNKFLEKRQFVELKEIIDSNVIAMKRRLANADMLNSENNISESYIKMEEIYDNLKNLQVIVSEQAAAFLDYTDLEGDDDYDASVYD